MKEDVGIIVSQIQQQMYRGLDAIFGEMANVFEEEKEEDAQKETEVQEVD